MRQSDTPSVHGWRPEDPRSLAPPRPPGAKWRGGPPLRLLSTGDRSRFRFGVLVRAGLVSPHTALLELWWVPASFTVVIAWFCALIAGRVPVPLHRFHAALVRYQTRVSAYGLLLADPFPGFTGRTSYPFDLELAASRRYSRLRALLYLPIVTVLAICALTAFFALLMMAPLAWLWALIRGRSPRWYQRAATPLLAFIAQSLAFGLLVTDRLPEPMRVIAGPAVWKPTSLPQPRAPAERASGVARLGIVAGVAALVAAGLASGHWLWHTTVPAGLAIPQLAASNYFGGDALAGNARAADRADLWFIAAQLVSIVALGLFAWRGRGLARHSAAGPIGTGMFLGMIATAWAALLSAPFLVVGVLALPDAVDTGPVGLELPLDALAQMTNVAIVLFVAMAVARRLPHRWWVPASLAVAGLLALSVLVAPQIGYDAPKLKDPGLLADAHRLAAREGIPNAHIDFLDDRDRGTDTPTPTNAFAIGGGSSAEIVLQGSLRSRRELRAILAHEIGHVARNHQWRLFGWQLMFLLLAAGVVQLALRRRGDLYSPALVPLALVVFSIAHLAWTPLQVGASRRYEAEADWMGLQANRDPQGQIMLMRELALENGSAATRPWWSDAMFEDHPDIMSRIGMAVAWERRHP